MRQSLTAFRSRILSVAAVAALSGVAASCSLAEKQLFTSSTPNQREILASASADQPLPAPTTTVTRADLPPPPGAVASTAQQGAIVPATTVGSNGVTYAWSAVGGTVMTVGVGENLDTIALKYGVPQNQILSANQLGSASQVTSGRVLVIPHLVGVAPGQAAPAVVTAAPVGGRPQASGSTYTVMTGDTLYAISKKTGADANAILALNNLGNTSQIKAGQVLKLPGTLPTTLSAPSGSATAAAVPPVPTPAPAAAPTQLASNGPLPKLSAPPVAPAASKPGAAPAVAGASQIPVTQASLSPKTKVDDADGPSANGTTFRWPVRGRIIASFGQSPAGQRNDGINLAVPEGTSVKAAEAGTVIYAGNELEGYGNLILVRHADGWVSAYAHNKDILVKRGDSVARGQIIAHAGMTGSVSAPQVHFELRQGSKPVNPLDFLSG
jgi:murein DD-endopeptidase MepM/ murein hydrolase activator NlpD